jgi:lipopolysaccharide export system protein LptC
VAAGRVGLPVAALALLSTLFLMARTIDPNDALPFADPALAERVRDQQLTEPRIAGRTVSGTAFEIRADAARPAPGDPRRLSIEALDLTLGLPGDAAVTTVAAQAGEVDTGARSLLLETRVAIDTTDGFRLRTDRLEADLGRLRVTSPGPVRGEAPFGSIEAGAMTLTEDPEDGTRRFEFTDGVELLYVPPSPAPSEPGGDLEGFDP